jgi:hypothetical protein
MDRSLGHKIGAVRPVLEWRGTRARYGGSVDEERRDDEVREVARGRSTRTPFLVLGSVAATVWAVAALIAGVALLLWWLL